MSEAEEQDDDLATAALAVTDAHRSAWAGIVLHVLICVVIALGFITAFGWTGRLPDDPLSPFTAGLARISESITADTFGALEIVAVIATIAIAATVSRTEKESSLRTLDAVAGVDASAGVSSAAGDGTAAGRSAPDDRTRALDLSAAAQLVRLETFALLMYFFTTATAGVSLALSVSLFVSTSQHIAAITVLLLAIYLILDAATARLDSTAPVGGIMRLRSRAVATRNLQRLGLSRSDIQQSESPARTRVGHDTSAGAPAASADELAGHRVHGRASTRVRGQAGARAAALLWPATAVALLGTIVADGVLTRDPDTVARGGLLSAAIVLFLIVVLQQLTELASLFTTARRLIAQISAVVLVLSLVGIRWSMFVAADSSPSTLAWVLVSSAGFAAIVVLLTGYALGRTGSVWAEFARIDVRALAASAAPHSSALRSQQHHGADGSTGRLLRRAAPATSLLASGTAVAGTIVLTTLVSTGLLVIAVRLWSPSPTAAPPGWWQWWAVGCVILLGLAYADCGSEPRLRVLTIVPAALLALQLVSLGQQLVGPGQHAAAHVLAGWLAAVLSALVLLIVTSAIAAPAALSRSRLLTRLSEGLQRPVHAFHARIDDTRQGTVDRLLGPSPHSS